MSKRTFNIVLAVITVVALLAATALTSMSVEISKNKATSKAKTQLYGTWTDVSNPQMIIQFNDDEEYRVMGQTQAHFQVDPNNSILTLNYTPEQGERTEYYSYGFDPNHSQLTLKNVDTGQEIVYSR